MSLWWVSVSGRCCAVTVLAVVGGCVLMRRLARSSIRRKKFNVSEFTSQPGMLVLHQFSRGKTCPNLSPFALKLESFLRLSNIPHVVDTSIPFGPKTKCPWVNMEETGEPVGDSQLIINTIVEREKCCPSAAPKPRLPAADGRLTPRERGALAGLGCLVEEQLFWCVIYWRYHLDGCRVFLTTQRFPRFLNFAFPLFMSRGIKKKATMQGIAIHSPEEVFRIAKNTCQSLDDYLGDSPYFCGSDAGTADCAIFGGLAQIRWNAPNTNYEKLVTEVCPRLGAYCDRMKERIYPDWNELINEPYGG